MLHDHATLVLVLLSGMTAAGADEPMTSPTEVIRSHLETLRTRTTSHEAALRAAKSEEERARLQEEHEKLLVRVTRLFMTIAKEFPWHPATVDAITWVLIEGAEGLVVDYEAQAEAFDLLTTTHRSPSFQIINHLSDERIADLCLRMERHHSFGEATEFYRTVMARSENRRVRALAMYALADRTRYAARSIRNDLSKPGDPTNRLSEVHYTEAEAKRLASEAEALFRQLVEDYSDIKLGPDPLGEVAAANLAAAETEVGRLAPEIEGEDAEGRWFKLSDYRGKVVVLSFWAGWCPPCMELVPEERTLVERMEGKPFVLLGINSDLTREEFREVNSAKQVPWRSWWNGVNELISTRWNVETWPTLYVIDRKGVIRSGRLSFSDVREKNLEHLIEQLIRED